LINLTLGQKKSLFRVARAFIFFRQFCAFNFF